MIQPTEARAARVLDFFGLQRNIVLVSGAMFLMGMGEQLWRRFMPKYLEALGAPVLAIGLYGTTESVLDGTYQYPGGWVADRRGRRFALLLFAGLAALGYAVYWAAPSWPFLFVGLAFAMAWSGMASSTLFAVVGDSLPKGRRAVGFTVQSILKRLPIVIAPTLGGVVIVAYGIQQGIRFALLATIVLAIVSIAILTQVRIPLLAEPEPTGIRGVWRALPASLRWLLLADVFARTCESMVDVFVVLYATNIVGATAPQYGMLVAVEMITAVLVYLPAAKAADRLGRKPFVIATYVAFALFPLAVAWSRTVSALVLAFVVAGLREIGEPARKALILDLAEPHLRARSVGLYYLIRSVAIAPAAVIGGMLWKLGPQTPFYVAATAGLVGTIIFASTVSERGRG
jgi:MFS family permease